MDDELGPGRVGGHDVDQAVAVEVAEVERPPLLAAGRQRVEAQPAPAGVVVVGAQGQDPGPARLLLDRQQLGARLAVDLAEGVGPERLDGEPLLGAVLAACRRRTGPGSGRRCRR